jgi:methylenetetrahydrofolate dehydrogenase (NADP+)/methenyltetrahydrofolate cyclohydrolase
MVPFDRRLPADSSFEQVAEELDALNSDAGVSGVLLQLPLPDHLDGPELTAMIAPDKDVDGLTPVNAGSALAGAPRAAAVHAERRDGAAGQRRRELEGAEAVVSGARTCSASRWRSCCWPPTPP